MTFWLIAALCYPLAASPTGQWCEMWIGGWDTQEQCMGDFPRMRDRAIEINASVEIRKGCE